MSCNDQNLVAVLLPSCQSKRKGFLHFQVLPVWSLIPISGSVPTDTFVYFTTCKDCSNVHVSSERKVKENASSVQVIWNWNVATSWRTSAFKSDIRTLRAFEQRLNIRNLTSVSPTITFNMISTTKTHKNLNWSPIYHQKNEKVYEERWIKRKKKTIQFSYAFNLTILLHFILKQFHQKCAFNHCFEWFDLFPALTATKKKKYTDVKESKVA